MGEGEGAGMSAAALMPADKGLLNGACNRSACLARPATWFNTSTRAHYCPDCAFLINRHCPRGEHICSPAVEDQA
jgi:hypothetical protein